MSTTDIALAGIEELLHIELDNNRIDVPDDLPEDPDGPVFYEEISWLLDLIERNEKELVELGVDFSDSQSGCVRLVHFDIDDKFNYKNG